MNTFSTSLHIRTSGKGLYEITHEANAALRDSGLREGILCVFCRHTSASLTLMENADPSAKHDLEKWLNRLVPENDPHFTHTLEGADDMPAHIKCSITRSSETIPFTNARLQLGTWQGIFLWEHRSRPHNRELIISILGS